MPRRPRPPGARPLCPADHCLVTLRGQAIPAPRLGGAATADHGSADAAARTWPTRRDREFSGTRSCSLVSVANGTPSPREPALMQPPGGSGQATAGTAGHDCHPASPHRGLGRGVLSAHPASPGVVCPVDARGLVVGPKVGFVQDEGVELSLPPRGVVHLRDVALRDDKLPVAETGASGTGHRRGLRPAGALGGQPLCSGASFLRQAELGLPLTGPSARFSRRDPGQRGPVDRQGRTAHTLRAPPHPAQSGGPPAGHRGQDKLTRPWV